MAKRKLPENKERLHHILKAIDEIFLFTEGITLEAFKSDRKTLLAIEKLFEIIGEAAYKIDKDFKLKYPDIDWSAIEGTRHILVHNYYEVSTEIFWNAKDLFLEDLKKDINSILEDLADI